MKRSGFTLIELLVVLAIIATLLTIAVPRYYSSLDKSKEAVLKENLYQLRDAIGKYYADRGKYPETLQALATDKYRSPTARPPGWWWRPRIRRRAACST
jgi:general secretion pathway protein G